MGLPSRSGPLRKPADSRSSGSAARANDLPARSRYIEWSMRRLPGMLHARMIRRAFRAVPVKVDEDSINRFPRTGDLDQDLLAVVAGRKERGQGCPRAEGHVVYLEPNFPGHDGCRAHPPGRSCGGTSSARTGNSKSIKQAVASSKGIRIPTQSHSSMDPPARSRCTRRCRDHLDVDPEEYDSAYCVAELLGLARDKVRAIWMFGTGSYGRNEQGDATADAAVLSKHLGRPVRVQYMRHEGLAWDPKGTASINRSRAGLDANGRVIAYENISKAFSRLDNNTRETRAADVLAGQLLGLPLNAGQSFEIPVASYTFDHGRLGWEIIPPLMERASPLRSTHLRDRNARRFCSHRTLSTRWRRDRYRPGRIRLHISSIRGPRRGPIAPKSGWKNASPRTS